MGVSTVRSLLPLRADTYDRHWLHDEDRDWPETNCYVDLWVELLHALGLDPVASLAFTVGTGFDGDQWEFFKPPAEDLREMYGLRVHEINVWRTVVEHILLQLELGNLLTVEVDAFFLPDTAGVSYGISHQKTTIVPQMIDVEGERLGYFHNATYHELGGDDFRAVLRIDAPATSLVPYVELIELASLRHPSHDELREVAGRQLHRHLQDRPEGNPVRALADRIVVDLPWLAEHPDRFHDYAFGTLRQLGAWASTTAAFATWYDEGALAEAVGALNSISSAAKTCQFKLARVLAGRQVDLDELFDRMVADWEIAARVLEAADDR